ncbi:MAG: hypothetical protein P3W97_010630 [Tepidimonas sp.]|uniref:hypothetical protein n=1 Tax=Tepidimonas sp. TaxID=2002775 RepID=UPI00259F5571|nr:hypothetical protein [Tepidimonas sp.]MDM7457679.1 hypothetical protein [Tepidimonas sp.]
MNASLGRFSLWLALLYAAWAILRLLLTPALEFDEAEQMLHQQWLRTSYGPQPPLFEWLVWLLRALLAMPALTAVVVLKAVALWGIGMAAALFMLHIGASNLAARAASMWVLSLPILLWDAPRTLTHSLLAAACVAALVASSAPLLLRPERPLPLWRWMLLGGLASAALLSKYNAALALAGWSSVLLAAWWRVTGDFRGWARLFVFHMRQAVPMWLPAMGLLAWHASEVWEIWPVVREPIVAKMLPPGDDTVIQGLMAWAASWLATLSVPGLLLGLAWWRSRGHLAKAISGHDGRPQTVWLTLAAVYIAVVGGTMLALVAAGKLAEIKERWILPLAVPMLLVLAPWWAGRGDAIARRLHAMAWVLVITALVLLLLRAHLLAWMGRPSWSQLPARAIAQWVDAQLPADTPTLIVAEPIQLAGAVAAYGKQRHPVLYRHSSAVLWSQQPACSIAVLLEGESPAGWDRLAQLGFARQGEVRSITLPRQPAVGDGVRLQLWLWRHPGRICPSHASVYDSLPP